MTDYVKLTDYAAKDALLSGNPSKVVKGTEIGAEFDAIATAVSTKLDAAVINAATSKTTPVDADELPITDSAASYALKKLTWANLKATIKTYYDSVTSTLTNKTLTAPVLTNPTVTASSGTAMKVTNTGTGDSFVVEDSASTDSTPFVIDANGNVVIGSTTLQNIGVSDSKLQVIGSGATDPSIGIGRFRNDSGGAILNTFKGRGASAGTFTIVNSGDTLFSLLTYGADGAAAIPAASISVAVDGTPGLNDMPGRLVFSTTADGASSPTERYRIASDGKHTKTGYVQVDNSTSNAAFTITNTGSGNSFVVEDSASTDSTPFVIDASGNVIIGHTAKVVSANLLETHSTAAVNNAPGIASFNWDLTATNAPAFNLYKSQSDTVGTYGIVSSGAVDSIGFWFDDGTQFIRGAAIQAAVDGTPGLNDMPGRLVFSTTADGASTPTERMRIDSAGQVGIGATATATNLRIAKDITGATVSYGVLTNSTIQSDVTSVASAFRSSVSTAAAAFTLTDLAHFYAEQGTIGATSAVTNQYGYYARSTLTGATNNYGFYGAIASGTGKYNFYAAGTAANYFAGETTVNSGLTIGRTAVTAPASTDGNVFSGTYTPTLTNTTNLDSTTAAVCHYMRVGNVVTVSGTFTADPTATGNTEFGMSLPIASNFASYVSLGGTAAATAFNNDNPVSITGDSTNDRAQVRWVTTRTAATVYSFTFTYLVI